MPHCPDCGQPHAADARFCGACGAALAARCAACGAVLAAGQRFCTACGAPAAAESSRPSAAAAPARTDLPVAAEVAAVVGADVAAGGEGERRHVTIAFSDLSGYTALNERVDPEDVAQVMAELRHTATAIVEAHGGIVNQVVGDEIMALYGVPQAGRDDALHALRSTLALHQAMQSLAERHAARFGVRLQLHSGVNSGLVVVRPGAPHQGRFGLTGDAVNTAARLLKLADAGEVVAGDDTWRQVSAHFDAERLAEAAVRGKALPVQPWRIVREVEAAPVAPLIGRDDELQHALGAWHACGVAGVRWVVIRGEAGIGKSRLLEALGQAVRGAGGAVAGAAVPDFGPARGAAAWAALLRSLLGVPAAAPDDAMAALGIAPSLRPHLCSLLGEPIPQAERTTFQALDAAARERGAVDAVSALLRARAAPAGLLVAFEDLHWAEPAALVQLARATAACRETRLLIAVTMRPQSGGFDAARRAQAPNVPALTLDLGPLADADARALALQLAGTAPEVVERCVERAGGNPLFLEQLLRAGSDALRDALPGTIQALVLARLDRLAPADKAALQAASVLGQQVDLGAWGVLVDAPRIEPLVEAGLLMPAEGAAQFVHALVRDGAYASLLKSRRRELHQRAAGWYQGRDAGLHAEHLERAESPLAAAAFAAAARAATGRWRYAEALELAERGLACATAPADRTTLAMLQGQTLRELGRNADALAAFERARDSASDDTAVATAWYEVAATQRLLSQVDAAWHALDEAQPVAERLGDTLWRSRIHYLRGNLCFARGDGAGCAREHGLALALAREAGDALAEAQALSGIGDAFYVRGRMHSAHDAYTRCLDACGRADAARFAVNNRAMVGWCLYWLGRPDDCRRELRAAGEAARAMSHRNALVMAEESLGVMLGWMEAADAEAVLRRSIELARDAGMKRFEVMSRVALAGVRRGAGDPDGARALAEGAWTLCVEAGAQAFVGPTALAELVRNAADEAEADAWLDRAEALLGQTAVAHNHLRVRAEAIRVHLARGDHAEVLRQADQLEAFVADEPFPWATHHVRAARALVRASEGTGDAALCRELAALRDEAQACAFVESARALAEALAVCDPRAAV